MRRSMDHAERLRRSEGAPLSDFRAVDDEGYGDGDEHHGDAAEEGAGPVDTQGGEHIFGEEGEAGAGEGAEECVCCYGRGGTVYLSVLRWYLSDCALRVLTT
jgi:hypothetical protein